MGLSTVSEEIEGLRQRFVRGELGLGEYLERRAALERLYEELVEEELRRELSRRR